MIQRRRLAKKLVVENITGDRDTDREITVFLNRLNKDVRVAANDAIEFIYDSGERGITIPDWAGKVRSLHPSAPVSDVLKMVAKGLRHIRRIGNGRYAWVQQPPIEDEPLDMNDPTERMIGGMVPMAYDALSVLKELGETTLQEWARVMAERMPGMSAREIIGYLNHVVEHMNVIQRLPGGRIRFAEEPKEDPMDTFRRIVSKK